MLATNRLFAASAFLFLLGGNALAASSEPPPQAPSIKIEQQPDSALKPQANPDHQTKSGSNAEIEQKGPSPTGEAKSRDQPNEGGSEASEFWMIGARSLKITDTLLVAFTFLLFLATVALFWATRDLVKDTKQNAERQQRAYVFIRGAEVRLVNGDSGVIAIIALKNFGQTPGYQFKTWTNIRIDDPDQPIFGVRNPIAQNSIIAPSADLNAPSPAAPITPAERAAIIAGTKKIYVWGEAAFVDAFGIGRKFIFRATAGGNEIGGNNAAGQPIWRGWGISPQGYEEVIGNHR
jgi:hypothetical protein